MQGRAGKTDSKTLVVTSEIDDITAALRRKECSASLERTQKLFEQLPNALEVIYTHAQAGPASATHEIDGSVPR